MKKSLISSHFAHHRPRDKLVTYYLTAYDLDAQRQNMAQEEASRMEMGGMAWVGTELVPEGLPFSTAAAQIPVDLWAVLW